MVSIFSVNQEERPLAKCERKRVNLIFKEKGKNCKNSRERNTVGYLSSVEGLFEVGSILIYDHESALLKYLLQQHLATDASTEKEMIQVHPELGFHFIYRLECYLNN